MLAGPLATPLATPLARSLAGGEGVFGEVPDPGYVFVYHEDGRQLFMADGRAVQVLAIYANS